MTSPFLLVMLTACPVAHAALPVRGVMSSYFQMDTDGSSYPHYLNIDVDVTAASIGANPEIVGTVAADNLIRIKNRIVSGGLVFDSTQTPTAITMSGTFSGYGIDMKDGTFTGGSILFVAVSVEEAQYLDLETLAVAAFAKD